MAKHTRFFHLVVILAIAATSTFAQERETVPVEDLFDVFNKVSVMAEDVAEKRKDFSTEATVKLFLETVIDYQKQIEPIIVLIAQTDAPKEAQLYAISVAIAVKETDLALWHYINAFVSNQQKYLNSADVFLRESLSEFDRAKSIEPTG